MNESMAGGGERIDRRMVALGLCDSRARAQDLIEARLVEVDGEPVCKPSHRVRPEAGIRVVGVDHPYVSRGGQKLAAALEHFSSDAFEDALPSVAGRTALDVGASTGGFTDCLLRRGVGRVIAVDVGRDQLAPRLRADPRVVSFERQDIRTFELTEPVDLIVVDCSFISLSKILPSLRSMAMAETDIVALVKPQFELDRARVRRGVVRDEVVRIGALNAAADAALAEGFVVRGDFECPVPGRNGNVEYFVWLRSDHQRL